MVSDPAGRRINRREKLRGDLGGHAECGIVENGEIFLNRASGDFPALPSMTLCRLGSALTRLASTAKPSPLSAGEASDR